LDWIARYGGEEFLIVLPETGPQGALIMSERLRNTISNQKFIFHDKIFHITSSFGISGFDSALSDENISSEMLINIADQHLYQCKLEGRNRVKAGYVNKDDTLILKDKRSITKIQNEVIDSE
jgi:diguanylate cyclase (GGDEF)-like protein